MSTWQTKLQSVQVALFVVSSTGDGDPPENAESLFNAVRRKTHAADMLAGLRYSVLGEEQEHRDQEHPGMAKLQNDAMAE